MADLPLFEWTPPATTADVIVFPVSKRVGPARKAAEGLARSRTNREATASLNRSLQTLESQLAKAGVPKDKIKQCVDDFVYWIYAQAFRIDSKFLPNLPGTGPGSNDPRSNGGGDDA